MARALDLHSRGQGFDSLILHIPEKVKFIDILEETKENRRKTLEGRFERLVGFISLTWVRARNSKKVRKGVRRMPWLSEAKKDVISCDKLWGGANDC